MPTNVIPRRILYIMIIVFISTCSLFILSNRIDYVDIDKKYPNMSAHDKYDLFIEKPDSHDRIISYLSNSTFYRYLYIKDWNPGPYQNYIVYYDADKNYIQYSYYGITRGNWLLRLGISLKYYDGGLRINIANKYCYKSDDPLQGASLNEYTCLFIIGKSSDFFDYKEKERGDVFGLTGMVTPSLQIPTSEPVSIKALLKRKNTPLFNQGK